MRTLDELRALYEAMPIDRLREAVAEGEASFRPEAWRTIQEEVRRRREDGRWPSDSELGIASPSPTARDTDSIFANDLSAYYPGSSAAGSPGTGAGGDLLEGRNAERFQLRALLLDPRHTVAYLVSTGKGWKVPYVGFALLAYAEGIDRAAQRLGDAPVIGVILTSVTLAFVLGAWMWAFVYGGLIHLSARVLKGRKGYEDTIRALGYAFFWPAALASGAVTLQLVVERGSGNAETSVLVLLLIQGAAGVWSLYAAVLALQVRHGFGWWRAAASYVLGVAMLLVPAFAAGFLLAS